MAGFSCNRLLWVSVLSVFSEKEQLTPMVCLTIPRNKQSKVRLEQIMFCRGPEPSCFLPFLITRKVWCWRNVQMCHSKEDAWLWCLQRWLLKGRWSGGWDKGLRNWGWPVLLNLFAIVWSCCCCCYSVSIISGSFHPDYLVIFHSYLDSTAGVEESK